MRLWLFAGCCREATFLRVFREHGGRRRAAGAARSRPMAGTLVANALDEALRQCRDMDAAVNERLACYAQAVHRLTPDFAAAVDRLVDRLAHSGAGAAAPMPGEPMPPFMLPDEAGRIVSLETLLRRGPVAVTFHRGHWCPYCRININALVRAQGEIANGGQIVAIMPERQEF